MSDIPGNRKSDLEEEAFWDTLYTKAKELGIDTETDAFEQFGAFIWELVGKAWSDGYSNGTADADLAAEFLQHGR